MTASCTADPRARLPGSTAAIDPHRLLADLAERSADLAVAFREAVAGSEAVQNQRFVSAMDRILQTVCELNQVARSTDDEEYIRKIEAKVGTVLSTIVSVTPVEPETAESSLHLFSHMLGLGERLLALHKLTCSHFVRRQQI